MTAPIRRTFLDKDVLSPDYVNGGFNPATAEHIPYGVAAGTATANIVAASALGIVVAFPAGRFTQPPVVTATIGVDDAKVYGATVIAHTATVAEVQIRIQLTGAQTVSVPIKWHAIQMDA